MADLIVKLLLWFTAVGCGLIAGIYFAFSTFIMPALARIEPVHAVSAMNSINSTILRSLFMPLFFGTTLTSFILAVIALLHRRAPGRDCDVRSRANLCRRHVPVHDCFQCAPQ